jgi:hypothetical protein
MRFHLCVVKKSFQTVGLVCHKIRSFPKHAPKVITGVVLTDAGLRLPNRRHLRIAMNINRLDAAPSRQELQSVRARLLGQITEASRVDDHWKARLHAYKSLLNQIALRTDARLRDASEQPRG